jgi:hypothetical protein
MNTAASGDVEKLRLKTFTSEKLDVLTLACNDVAIQSYDFKVLFCIAQHVNQKSDLALVSDELISDETCGSRRNVIRARKRLRRAGWLNWDNTRGVNRYWLCKVRENEIRDTRLINKEARNEKRQRGANSRRGSVTPPSLRKDEPMTSVSQQEVPPRAQHAVPPLSPKHLIANTVSQTPYSYQPAVKVIVEGKNDGMPDIPAFLDRRNDPRPKSEGSRGPR